MTPARGHAPSGPSRTTAFPHGSVSMVEAVALDSGPLGRLAHPARNLEIAAWLEHLLEADIPVIIPEIVDYEVRRSFLLEGLTRSVVRLDSYLPSIFLTSAIVLRSPTSTS